MQLVVFFTERDTITLANRTKWLGSPKPVRILALLILTMKFREGGALRAPPSLNFIVGLSSARILCGVGLARTTQNLYLNTTTNGFSTLSKIFL